MKKKLVLSVALLSLGLSAGWSQEIATWAGWKKAAITFTFDDAANEYNSHKWAAEQLDSCGFPGTFYVVTGWTRNSWSNYQAIANKGHEIGSHTDTHQSVDSELASSKRTINQNISGQECITIAYPNCEVPTENKVLENYIGGRICGGQINSKSPSNFARLDCRICGSSGINKTSEFTSYCEDAKNKNGWAVFLIHGIQGKQANGSFSPTSPDAFTGTLAWLKQNKSTYWVCTFRDAIKYIKERENTTLKKISEDANNQTYMLALNSELKSNTLCKWNYPLSIKVPLPNGWSEVVVTQSNNELEATVDGSNIYFEAIPDGGDILISSAAAIVPDPTFTITVPQEAQWCIDSTYTLQWSMSGDANGNTYSLNWNTGGSSSIDISSIVASSEWSNDEGTFSWSATNILMDDGSHGENSRWGSAGDTNEYVIFNLSSKKTVGGIQIDEFTEYGTVSSFEVQYDKNGSWETIYEGTTIGNDFQASFAPVFTSSIRLYIKNCVGGGANINYVALQGVSQMEVKTGISGNGSFQWNPTAAFKGAGTLTINKSNGKTLASTNAITIASCDAQEIPGGGSQGGSTTCYDGNGYTGPSCDEEGTGAYHTGVYRNLFTEYLGKSEADVDAKIESIWNHFFTGGTNTVYYETSDGMAYIYDTGSKDVRTEGMSYGMMICVQLNHQKEFDKIWKWAKKYMQYKPGNTKEGLFAWQCNTDGSTIGDSPSCAPDGEAYFLTALFFASHRWGNDGEIDYESEAQYLIDKMLDKPNHEAGKVSPIFNLTNHLITFGETSYSFTDPSYNLPGFFELWAKWTNTNKEFWAKTADAARDLLYKSSHSSTGLFPDYSQFDGTPYYPDWCGYDASKYMYDAIRCPMNVGMDYHWFGKDSRQKTMMKNILTFFQKDGFQHGYFTVSGGSPEGNYSEGMSGANGVGVFAIDDESLAKTYVQRLWNTNAPSGQWRYYNGMVYMLSMLHASGKFKIWKPAPAEKDTLISGTGSVEFEGETYTENTNFCYFKNCTNYNVTIVVEDATSNAVIDNDLFAIFPNPADDQVTIQSNEEISSVEIIDLLGHTLYSQKGSNIVPTHFLAPGNYVIKASSKEGTLAVKRLVVKR